jgi:hypothetical protein
MVIKPDLTLKTLLLIIENIVAYIKFHITSLDEFSPRKNF